VCVCVCGAGRQAWSSVQTQQSTLGDDLQVVKQDQLIRSDPGDYKRRRTIVIQRAHGGSCGFTLQVHELESVSHVLAGDPDPTLRVHAGVPCLQSQWMKKE